jgi:L-seryl-tRNA(Ser) seleniumtransferase
MLCGRKDLIMSAAVQNLDLDIFEDMWTPPKSLIDKSKLKGTPQHGIGRSCKAGKEEIVGLLTALQIFLSETDAERHTRWLKRLAPIAESLSKSKSCRVEIEAEYDKNAVPLLVVTLAKSAASARKAIAELIKGSPSIHVDPARRDQGKLVINPLCFDENQAPLIAKRLLSALG